MVRASAKKHETTFVDFNFCSSKDGINARNVLHYLDLLFECKKIEPLNNICETVRPSAKTHLTTHAYHLTTHTYVPSNDVNAKILFNDTDVLFEDQTFETFASLKMLRYLFINTGEIFETSLYRKR